MYNNPKTALTKSQSQSGLVNEQPAEEFGATLWGQTVPLTAAAKTAGRDARKRGGGTRSGVVEPRSITWHQIGFPRTTGMMPQTQKQK